MVMQSELLVNEFYYACLNGRSMDPASRGMDGGWQGIRTRKEFKPFPDVNGIADKRDILQMDRS
jgi:hypothetical protein